MKIGRNVSVFFLFASFAWGESFAVTFSILFLHTDDVSQVGESWYFCTILIYHYFKQIVQHGMHLKAQKSYSFAIFSLLGGKSFTHGENCSLKICRLSVKFSQKTRDLCYRTSCILQIMSVFHCCSLSAFLFFSLIFSDDLLRLSRVAELQATEFISIKQHRKRLATALDAIKPTNVYIFLCSQISAVSCWLFGSALYTNYGW